MKKQFLSLIALFMVFGSQAQSFNGKYTIESKEMIDGIEYSNAIAHELFLTQTKDSLKIQRVTVGGEGKDVTSFEAYSFNGKPVTVTTGSKRTKTSVLAFDKGVKSFTITTTFSYPEKPGEVEFKNTEVWTIEDDGTITIVKTSDATVTDDWTIKAIFKKG